MCIKLLERFKAWFRPKEQVITLKGLAFPTEFNHVEFPGRLDHAILDIMVSDIEKTLLRLKVDGVVVSEVILKYTEEK